MQAFIILLLYFGGGWSLCAFSQGLQNKSNIEAGKAMFHQLCATCHANPQTRIAPSFKNVRKARGKEWVYSFVNNPLGLAGSNTDAKTLIQKWKITMPAYPDLQKAEIDAICDYVDGIKDDPPVKRTKS